jgi:hypothetical protein
VVDAFAALGEEARANFHVMGLTSNDESSAWSRTAFGSPPSILVAVNLNERLPSAIIRGRGTLRFAELGR